MTTQIHSTTAAMAYALRWGALPASLVTPALLADLVERGWAQPGTTTRGAVLTLTKKGHVEGVCLLS